MCSREVALRDNKREREREREREGERERREGGRGGYTNKTVQTRQKNLQVTLIGVWSREW